MRSRSGGRTSRAKPRSSGFGPKMPSPSQLLTGMDAMALLQGQMNASVAPLDLGGHQQPYMNFETQPFSHPLF